MAKTKWKVLKDKYALISIPINKGTKLETLPKEFLSIIYEKDEITVITKESYCKNFKNAEIEKGFRIITYNEVLDWNITGFIAKVGKILADNKIVMGVISAYLKDHFLIKDKDLKKAMNVLKGLRK